MEAVRAFNNELSALYEVKPPISRAKMASVTKTAIKAIKYYKHVVQSIEKFIQKCKPEYKVPGLYVIDSVVRQSRHQFGSNKDVFAPRFTKNIITTFQNLFKCPGEERSKIVRVLNLWQKNDVFPSEIVQPLLDLAADPTKPSNIAAAQTSVDGWLAANGKPASTQPQQQAPQQQQQQQPSSQPSNHEEQMNQSAAESMLATQNDMLNTVTQLLQHTNSSNMNAQQQQLQHLQLLQQRLVQQTQLMQPSTGAGPIIDPNLLAQIQTLTNQLLSKTDSKPEEAGFNKKLLDFDYGESDDEDDKKPSGNPNNVTGNVVNILNDPSLMQQIHQVSQSIQKNEEMKSEMDEERRRVLEQQQAEFDQQISMGSMPPHHPPPPHQPHHQPHQPPPPMHFEQPPPMPDSNNYREEGEYEEELNDDDFREHHQLKDRDEREGRRDRRRRSRSRSRSPKRRKRTRSRSRDRDRRRRSNSISRHKRSRSKDREREEREKQKEKEKERKRKSLPPIKEGHVSVCTTTIWIGHLNKFTQEEDLKAEIERYGPVQTINMVPPRGCAYIVMQERKDAFKAIDRLKGYKLNNSALKTAWAQSSGIRESEFKSSWEVDVGTMFIPWERIPSDLSTLLEGAIIDSESLPETMKDVPTEKSELPAADSTEAAAPQAPGMPDQTVQPQMPAQAPMMGMMQPGMPPQMSGMMPGMMMPMQRPLVPGMPGQAMGLAPGPPQMMPGSARPGAPPLPGVRPPGSIGGISIANTTTSSIAQTIQNMLPTSAALVHGSPAGGPRPPMGFPPGAPRFGGFNPNMPPPGFRMPPPGFPAHMRLRMPTMLPPSDKPEESLNKDGPTREMIWPPDSNEKDEDDMDEDESEGDKEKEADKTEGNEPSGFKPVDHPPFGMMGGPMPPGGFPPGGPHAPWNISMRIRGPRPMRFPMGMPPDMFSNGPNGPRGPMMGGPPMPFPPMGMGFPPFQMGPPKPVSLLDLDIKPPPRFSDNKSNEDEGGDGEENEDEMQHEEGERNEEERNEGEREDTNEEGGFNGGEGEEEDEPDMRNSYPFNTWQSVAHNRRRRENQNESREDNEDMDRSRDNRQERGWGDEDDNRSRRDNRDRGDRDRRDRGGWERDGGDKDRNRDSGDRDRNRDRDSGRDRGERDRDRDSRDSRRRDDRRDRDKDRERGDRGRDRDREGRRQRKSRWGDPIENTGEDSAPPVLEREEFFSEGPNENNEESVNNSVNETSNENEMSNENSSEAMPSAVNDSELNPSAEDTNDNQASENDMDMDDSLHQTEESHIDTSNVNGENVNETQDESGPPPLDEEQTSGFEQDQTSEDLAPVINGPGTIEEEEESSSIPNKLDVIPDLGNAELPQENTSETVPEMADLEEGELDT